MMRKWKFLLVGVSCIVGTAMAQNSPILLFPKGAPGETTKLIEKADTDGGKTGGETVLRITNVSEPTITVYPAPDEVVSYYQSFFLCSLLLEKDLYAQIDNTIQTSSQPHYCW